MITRDLRLPGTLACLDAAQDALAEMWTEADDVDPTDRMLFETALVEILGNVVEHARTPDGEIVDVDLQMAVHPDRVEARVQDNGTPPPSERNGNLPEDELAEGGRGFALASAVADVAHTRLENGNIWVVVRRR